MTKKKEINCKNCMYNGKKCLHESNKGFVVLYRTEQSTYFYTPEELNKDGECLNYVELSEK